MMQSADTILDHLPQDSILKSFSPDDCADLFRHAVRRPLKKGEVLFNHGDPADSMVIILDGVVKVSVFTEEGREIVLDYVGSGGILGEIAVLDGGPRAATVTAIEPVNILVFQRRDLLPALRRNLDAAVKVVELLCRRLRRTNAMVQDNTGLAMGPKLARGILRLMEDHGISDQEERAIGFRINQTDLGNYVSLSRENVNRQLREWASEGLVRVDKGRITVLDEDLLREVAEYLD